METSAQLSRIALVQMTSGIDPDANLAAIDRALADAAAGGAAMAFLPEMSLLLDRDRERSAAHIAREADSPWPAALQDMARRHGLWLHSGSMPLLAETGDRRVNRSHVIAADGTIRARYDKIHMFDVDLPTGERWSESASYAGGDALAVVETPVGMLGLSVCYDLRFPELYRALVDRGATLLAVPAAFTVPTGEAHWHVLLRARAVETGCHVVAAAQCGPHADGRATYGHSLVADPWGAIAIDAGGYPEDSGFTLAFAEIDAAAVQRARAAIPLARSRTIRNIEL
ncbi:carbon-nitrogen hydrolase family protein [Sphingopyxis sp. GW247-27LB]|uniref:carbon-nitrogen hydrolase family protein n=1 Tax=Sphingopyxis sp. GW247-27LB TaxID=2012632 RepID=UPI000BA644E5|nr:carbon-nitrogen hydrolase family protein [Sphingopyxis sp. GW247-27LB]PAL24984.1 nitrilase [Sphingopyxis sp. GW247-27LB]